jgi:hypothetical protein
MQIDVSQLQLGDEFLYAIMGNIARAKVVRPVEKKKVQPNNPYHPNKVYYKSVKCKVAMEERTFTTSWNNRTYTKKEYCASDNYSVEKFIDLNWRNVWLIKRED